MSDSFITQCPHCHTSFRVNQAQLGAANGAVRCGSCLKVFNALQYMQRPASQAPAPNPAPVPAPAPKPFAQPAVSAPPQPAQQPPAPRPVAPAAPAKPTSPPVGATLGWPLAPHSARPAAENKTDEPAAPAIASTNGNAPSKVVDETLWIHDDLDLDSLNLDEELAKLDEFELSQEFRELKAAPKPADALLGAQHKPRDPHDERWAEALLEDERHAPGARQEPSLGNARTESEEPEAALPPIAHEPAVVVSREAEPDEDDEPLPALSARRDDDEIAGPPDEDEDDEPREPTVEASDEPEEDDEPAIAQSTRNEPALRDESLRELSDEPLQLDWQKPKGRWGRRLLWTLLILLAAGGLGAQYVTYHFDELAREDAYRPWFAELCPQLGCSLPSKVDVEQIRSSNLVVRSHPDFSGALVVDAIIYNRASFSQPFPLLELRFADINGQLLASRSFKPSEYLGGELAGQTEMPPQTPIHISLDILDPGPKAVNYSLSFHSPE